MLPAFDELVSTVLSVAEEDSSSEVESLSSVEVLSSELVISELSSVELLSTKVSSCEDISAVEFSSNELLSAVALDWEITSCISEEERGVLFVTLSAKISEPELLSVEGALEVGM